MATTTISNPRPAKETPLHADDAFSLGWRIMCGEWEASYNVTSPDGRTQLIWLDPDDDIETYPEIRILGTVIINPIRVLYLSSPCNFDLVPSAVAGEKPVTTNDKETPIDATADAQDAILAKAREMDAHRKIRAIYRVGEWQASPKDNGATLIHRHETDSLTGEAKTYSDASHLRNGFDCSCGDAAQYVRPMRRRVAALLCGTPVSCQHCHARMLLRGGKLMVFCPKDGDLLATATLGPDGVRAQISIERGMNDRWTALVADATRCWGDKAVKA